MSRNNDSIISIYNCLFWTMKYVLICLVIAIIVNIISGVIVSYFTKISLIGFNLGCYYGIFVVCFILRILRCPS